MEGMWERRADERRRAITAIHNMMDMRLDPNRESRSGPSRLLGAQLSCQLSGTIFPDTTVTQLYIVSYVGFHCTRTCIPGCLYRKKNEPLLK